MEAVVTPRLYRKIEILPSRMQEEVSLFTDFLLAKSKVKPNVDLNTETDDHHFSRISLLSLSNEWDSSEDEEWDAILSQMPSIQ
jgi:hypothetical protein